MKICGIYKITNIINGKIYIGQSNNCKTRFYKHKWYLQNNNHNNQYLQNTWNEYGKDAFKFEVYIECKAEELNEWEIFLIKAHDLTNRDYGYNSCNGGNYITFTEETRMKMSKAGKGRMVSTETRKKMSKSRIGIIISKETCKKISESNSGTNHWNYGKKRSNETKKKISETSKGKPWTINRRNASKLKLDN